MNENIIYGRNPVLEALKSSENKVIVVLDDAKYENTEAGDNVGLAGRNLPNVLVQLQSRASVYQMMNADTLVITKAAVEKYEEALK